MIRPVLDRGATTVPGRLAWIRDVRVPEMFPGEFEPRPLGELAFNLACPDGRHTFDVIEAVEQERWSENPADPSGQGVNRQRFRMTLTCITCGRVERRQGEYQDTGARTTMLTGTAEVQAICAQMIRPGTRWPKGRDAWPGGAEPPRVRWWGDCPEIGRRGAIHTRQARPGSGLVAGVLPGGAAALARRSRQGHGRDRPAPRHHGRGRDQADLTPRRKGAPRSRPLRRTSRRRRTTVSRGRQ